MKMNWLMLRSTQLSWRVCLDLVTAVAMKETKEARMKKRF